MIVPSTPGLEVGTPSVQETFVYITGHKSNCKQIHFVQKCSSIKSWRFVNLDFQFESTGFLRPHLTGPVLLGDVWHGQQGHVSASEVLEMEIKKGTDKEMSMFKC